MSLLSDLENLPLRLILGLLKLSDQRRPDSLEAINLLKFAYGNGVRVFDTADAYCQSEDDFHYGEHLIRQAFPKATDIFVATKVGMIRPHGKWIPCGRPDHLQSSVQDCLTALGTDQLFWLQLHVRDPQVPFDETLQCLSELQQEEWVRHVGLCNTSIADAEYASQFFEVASIQNELNIFQPEAAQTGLVTWCERQQIPFLASRCLGGSDRIAELNQQPILTSLAERHRATAPEIALQAIREIGPHVWPIVGATRLQTLKSSVQANQLNFDQSDSTALSMVCSFASRITTTDGAVSVTTTADEIEPVIGPEVVIVMGIQGSGKSELVQKFVTAGYVRLNRDELGGTLDSLVPMLLQWAAAGQSSFVLDNTYATAASRRPVIAAAQQIGVPVKCVFLETPLHEACRNVAQRMLERYGMLLGPTEMKVFRKVDNNLPPLIALQKFVGSLQRPSIAEGFRSVATVPFQRRESPHSGRAILLDCDGTLRSTLSGNPYPQSADDVILLPNRTAVLKQYVDDGWQLFFVSNQAGISSNAVTHESVQAAMYRTAELLQLPVTEVVYCAHPAHPIQCFCRKPMPGLGVYLAHQHSLNLAQCMMVGDRDTDAQFAANLGMSYHDEADFFGCES